MTKTREARGNNKIRNVWNSHLAVASTSDIFLFRSEKMIGLNNTRKRKLKCIISSVHRDELCLQGIQNICIRHWEFKIPFYGNGKFQVSSLRGLGIAEFMGTER